MVHYYYDTKDDLLAAFLDYLLEQFVDSIHDVETTDPEERLDLLLDELLVKPQENQDLSVALLEMRSQAPHKEAFSDSSRTTSTFSTCSRPSSITASTKARSTTSTPTT